MKMGGTERNEKIVDLPSDVLLNILSRLPAVSLIRFTLVNKSWRALISDVSLISLHLSVSRAARNYSIGDAVRVELHFRMECPFTHLFPLYRNPLECNLVMGEAVTTIKRPPPFPESLDEIVCSLDGLLLYRHPGVRSNSPWTLYVYNPATRETVVLPRLRRSGGATVHQLVFDPLARVYKVLHVPDVLSKETFSQIFTLGIDRKWRILNGSHSGLGATSTSRALEYPLLNGAIQWARDSGWAGSPFAGNPVTERTIVSFKVGTEEFQIFSHPNCCPPVDSATGGSHQVCSPLVEINGFLHLMHPNSTKQTMDMWVLKDYDGWLWEKGYTVSLNFIEEKLVAGVTLYYRAKFDSEILLEQVVYFVARRHNYARTSNLFYNSKLRTFRRLQNMQGGPYYHSLRGSYVESLVSWNSARLADY